MPADLNLANLFARIWHDLARDMATFDRVLRDLADQRTEVLFSAHMLDERLATQGPEALAYPYEQISQGDEIETRRVILIAQAIDRWYGRLSSENRMPRQPADVALARANRTLLRFGRFNTDTRLGYVLPKRPRWGRWSDPDLELPNAVTSPWDAFKSLIVTPTEIKATDPDNPLQSRAVRFSYRFVDPTVLRAVEVDWIPIIGFAPLAEALDDLDIRLVEQDGKHWYDAQVRDLSSRVAAAIQALCEAGANLIIFPEMVVHPEALNALKGAIATHGPSSQLRLVLAGTSRQPSGGARPYNEARLFNHRGTEIGRQRKLHRWNLPHDLRDRYGLQHASLHQTADLFEFIIPGEEVIVIEQTQFGRMAVMICEDLARSEPGQWLRQRMLLDWLLTPILDGSMHPSRWMAQRGSNAALGGRCRVIVANSFSLTHRQNTQHKKAGWATLSDCGVGLCIDIVGGKARYCLEHLPLRGRSSAVRTIRWNPEDWSEWMR
jgi:predicted amidohydrolase